MFKLENVTLRVKKIRGARGDFCVADLSCEEGEFKVKDAVLDQFEDGEYTGTVWISQIYLRQYVSWGKGITEICARLHDLQLNENYERLAPAEHIEPDPLEEEQAPLQKTAQLPVQQFAQQPQPSPQPSQEAFEPGTKPDSPMDRLKKKLSRIGKKPVAGAETQKSQNAAGDPSELFGEVWERIVAREPVRLDATVDRERFRAQIAAMRDQYGYKLNSNTQVWSPQEECEESVPA